MQRARKRDAVKESSLDDMLVDESNPVEQQTEDEGKMRAVRSDTQQERTDEDPVRYDRG